MGRTRQRITRDICPICGSGKAIELYPSDIDEARLSFTYVKTPYSGKTFRTVKCFNCTHVFCSPLPKNLYKNYENVVDEEYLNYTVSIRESAKLIMPSIMRYVPTGKILDVGCATGEFLISAQKLGYKTEGLELSRWSSDIGRKKGLTIYRERLNSLSRKFPGRYDVVTLFGVIEHFEFPSEELAYIAKLLKPNGVLVVWTGNVDSLPSKLLKKGWWYWQGQHIQYFSHKSLNFLSEKCGFKHLETRTYPFVATYGLLENSLSRYKFQKIFMHLFAPLFKIKPNWTFYIPGEMLWFGRKVAKK